MLKPKVLTIANGAKKRPLFLKAAASSQIVSPILTPAAAWAVSAVSSPVAERPAVAGWLALFVGVSIRQQNNIMALL